MVALITISDYSNYISIIPLDHLMIETDAPYLTPVPFRGSENQPAYVKYVAQEIANIRETSFDEIAQATSENAERVFGI